MIIKRENYLKQIRPFMGSDLVKVLTGIRGSGKSVMLELVKDELCASGVDRGQFVSLNFEELWRNHHADLDHTKTSQMFSVNY